MWWKVIATANRSARRFCAVASTGLPTSNIAQACLITSVSRSAVPCAIGQERRSWRKCHHATACELARLMQRLRWPTNCRCPMYQIGNEASPGHGRGGLMARRAFNQERILRILLGIKGELELG